MKGRVKISVSNGSLKYEFELRRNITIIRGDSATGKTTLVEMIQEYYEAGSHSGITLECEKTCRVISGRDWRLILEATHDSIVFIDEGNSFLRSTDFSEAAQASDNYFVLVTREFLPNLPYSVDEIYGIRTSNKYAGLKQVYHELYHIYPPFDYSSVFTPEIVIVEDSNSGYEFFQSLADEKPYQVISAGGKAKMAQVIEEYPDKKILVIADGSAFGSEMVRITEVAKQRGDIAIFLPESFEWLVLQSGTIQYGQLNSILEEPSNYIESREYFSWERYFTHLLVEITRGTYLQYSKRKLNPAYRAEKIQKQIINLIQKIEL